MQGATTLGVAVRALWCGAVPQEDLSAVRDQGRDDVLRVFREASDDPKTRLLWAQGADTVDLMRLAVEKARQSGVTWRAIAEWLGEAESTVRVRYTQRGGGRWRRP